MTTSEQKQRVQAFFDQAETWQGQLYVDQRERFNRAMVRRKQYAFQMLNRLNGLKKGVTLDIGCGCGIYLEDLITLGFHAHGLEFSKDMLRACQTRLTGNGLGLRPRLICGDIEHIPFSDEGFDLVLCIGVLGYLLSDHDALSEIHRILKPGGFLVLALQNMLSFSNLDYVLRAALKSFIRPHSRTLMHEDPLGVSMMVPWIFDHSHYCYKSYNPWKLERMMAAAGFRFVDAMTFGYEFRILRRLRMIPESVLNAMELGLETVFRRVPLPYFSYSGDFYTGIFQREAIF